MKVSCGGGLFGFELCERPSWMNCDGLRMWCGTWGCWSGALLELGVVAAGLFRMILHLVSSY